MMTMVEALAGTNAMVAVHLAGAAVHGAGAAVEGVRVERSASSSKGLSRFLYRRVSVLKRFCALDWYNMSSARVRATRRQTHVGALEAYPSASFSSSSRDSLSASLSQLVSLTRAALCRLPLPLQPTIITTLPRLSHTPAHTLAHEQKLG